MGNLSAILKITASVIATVATLWINKIFKQYIQKWEDEKSENKLADEKKKLADNLLDLEEQLRKLREAEEKFNAGR
jgi:hypothetical protein